MNPASLFHRALQKYRKEGLWPTIVGILRHSEKMLLGNLTFKYATILRYMKQKYVYHAPADPYKVITVRPDEVRNFNETISTHFGLGIIKNGGWDLEKNCKPISSTTHYRGFKQRFEKGYDWTDTVYFEKRKEGLSTHKTKRLDYIDEIYNDMKENGYRPNYDAKHDAPEGGERQGQLQHIHALEPLVTIGRNGEVYLSEGFHRFALAKILDIESIPVNVLARHKKWQQIREQMYTNSNPPLDPKLNNYIEHPDLEDLDIG